MDWEIVYRYLKTLNWIVLLILSNISFFLMNNYLTLGIILGGLIIITNFNVLQYSLRRAFPSKGAMNARKLPIIAKYYFRLLLLGAIIYLLIVHEWVDPVGLAVGLSTVVISIVIFGITSACKTIT